MSSANDVSVAPVNQLKPRERRLQRRRERERSRASETREQRKERLSRKINARARRAAQSVIQQIGTTWLVSQWRLGYSR